MSDKDLKVDRKHLRRAKTELRLEDSDGSPAQVRKASLKNAINPSHHDSDSDSLLSDDSDPSEPTSDESEPPSDSESQEADKQHSIAQTKSASSSTKSSETSTPEPLKKNVTFAEDPKPDDNKKRSEMSPTRQAKTKDSSEELKKKKKKKKKDVEGVEPRKKRSKDSSEGGSKKRSSSKEKKEKKEKKERKSKDGKEKKKKKHRSKHESSDSKTKTIAVMQPTPDQDALLREQFKLANKGKANSFPNIELPEVLKKQLSTEKAKLMMKPPEKTPQGAPTPKVAPVKEVKIDTSDWKFHCLRVWSKPLRELPVAIDLPRLAPQVTIINEEHPDFSIIPREYVEAIFEFDGLLDQRMSNGEAALGFRQHEVFIVRGPVMGAPGWLAVEKANGVQGVVPVDYVRPVSTPPVSKEKRTLEVLATLTEALEGQNRANLVRKKFWKYIPKCAEKIRDVSREISKLLEEVLGETSVTVLILKACNQAIIAPAVIELTMNVAPKLSFKDGGGWRISITIQEEMVIVTHWKKQGHVPRPPETLLFEYFEWKLSITFDRKNNCTPVNFDFTLSDIKFAAGVEEPRKAQIMDILTTYFKKSLVRKDLERSLSVRGGFNIPLPASLNASVDDTPRVIRRASVPPPQDEFQQAMMGANMTGSTWEELIKKLEDHIDQQKFRAEWAALDKKEQLKSFEGFSEATQAYNMPKNRYTNILPYNNTRVMLSSVEGVEGSNYINANFVKAGDHSFIASQAPLVSTFDDFYRMVWEHNVTVVVMLTRLVEANKVKADNYLPYDTSLPVQFGDILVEIVGSETSNEDNRYLSKTVKMTKDGQVKHFTHYHYLDWPDHGVPTPDPMLRMMETVIKEQEAYSNNNNTPSGPQVVHCSAGIGRTGTWIALTHLLEEIQKASEAKQVPSFNLMKSIDNLRTQRSGMLTHIDQYQFCYETILSHLKSLQHPTTQ